MSEAWLRVYAADMRGEPEMALLGLAGQALLIHAWDIAKHGPVFGELRQKNGEPFTPATFALAVPGATVSVVRSWWKSVLGHEFAEQLDDGALRFPKLAKRQGYDATNAIRQKRLRNRRNGTSNTQSNGGSNGGSNGDPNTQSNGAELRVQSPETELGQSSVTSPRLKLGDRLTIRTPGMPETIEHAIRSLLDDLPDADEGTAGRLISLARRGATEADFHDAKAAIRATHRRRPSPYACKVIENRLQERHRA